MTQSIVRTDAEKLADETARDAMVELARQNQFLMDKLIDLAERSEQQMSLITGVNLRSGERID